MAFIVPVVRKEYNLYGQRKQIVSLAKSGRSNSTPVRIVSAESLERNLAAKQALNARRLRQTSASVSAPESPASVEQRRCSRRISIRHFSSVDSTESNATTDSTKRRVQFSHIVEIENSDDELENEDPPRHSQMVAPIKRSSLPGERLPTKTQQGARPRSVSLMEEPAPIQLQNRHSKLSTFLKLAKLARPGN